MVLQALTGQRILNSIVRLTSEFGFNLAAQRYIDLRTGRFISKSAIDRAMRSVLAGANGAMQDLSVQLQNRVISISQWRDGMAGLVKDVHLASASVARGGWTQLTPADIQHVRRFTRDQLRYLDRFAAQIADGTVRLDGVFLRRVELYALMGIQTQHEVERQARLAAGFNEERNLQAATESCDGCTVETLRGYVPVGQLVPLGARDCLSRCHCGIGYRNSLTGKEW